MRTRFLASRLLPDPETEIAPGGLLVEEDRIVWAGAASEAPAADETVDLPGAVLLPGLVNAHSHLDLTHLRDRVPFEGSFSGWIEGIARGRKEGGAGEAAERGIREALARGTTCFGDVVSGRAFGEIVAAFARTGARGRLYVEALGFRPAAAHEVFEEVWRLVEMAELPANVSTGLSPHAPYSVSRELLSLALSMAEGHGRPVAIHVAETLEELAFLRHGIGPLRDLLRKFGADDPGHLPWGGASEFVRELSLERARLALIHGNYLRPRDVPMGAFVVYCPAAHRFFGHPEHPVRELLEEGVRVALGSDSAASGGTVDILSQTQLLRRERPDLDERAVFRMATEWGAAALDLEAGRIEPGRFADFAAFTPALGHGVLGSPDARCILAAVGGRILHRS